MVKIWGENKGGITELVEIDPEDLRRALAEIFPHGDPLFQEISWSEQELYSLKNKDYAAGGDDPNGNFNRVSKIFSLYPGLLLSDPRVYAFTQVMKQVDQVLWSLNRGYEGVVEGLDSRLADIHVYTKITRMLNQHMRE
jgi:hypothetical protein